LTFDTADPTYQELRSRVLQTGARVVPFVGAGLSVYGRPEQRLPLWRELLERLIAEGQRVGLIADEGDTAISAAVAAGRYIEAMDRILGILGEPTFKRVVERELDVTEKPTPPAIAELVGVGWSLIVTTNLDRLIARAYLERYGRQIDAFTSLDIHRLAASLAGSHTSSETLLAHIHGAVDVYPSWRLTRSHYQQLLQDRGYVQALQQLFLRQVFFVGFGLQDDDLDFLLETIAEIYPAGVGQFYALIARSRKTDPTVQQLVRDNGLRPIFYDVDPHPDPEDPFGGHGEVLECLQDLATGWATGFRAFDVTLEYFPELDDAVVGRESEMEQLQRILLGEPGCIVQLIGLGGVGKTSVVQRFLADRAPPLVKAGYARAVGCSFYRADVGQFIQDLGLATVGPLSVPLPEQVERICEYVGHNRIVLVLDGIETLADAQRHVRNPYLLQIVEKVIAGRGAVITTSRVTIRGGPFERAPVVEVAALSHKQIVNYLDRWGLARLGDQVKLRLTEITAGHPLALRIVVGVLGRVAVDDALRTIERSSVIDVTDEVDPLRENRLARVMDSYIHHLEDVEVEFLMTMTVFDEPAAYPFAAATLARRYPDTDANARLAGQDLRALVVGLLDRRLLTISAVGELSCHPTVWEYFGRRARRNALFLAPLHRQLTTAYLHDTAAVPQTFAEARPLLAACRHAAACEDWTLFDDTFRRRLMHGYLAYLCDYLGAWQEALTVARLADGSSFPSESTPEPAYYPLIAARCLKHLGRSAESRTKYLEGLYVVAASRDPECALYVNNFLTLLIWRGELTSADQLAELNVRALSWITEEWRRRWQIEHGFSSIAYLKLLQGRLDEAAAMFDYAERIWDDYDDERVWVWDYYPFYRGELVLLLDPAAHDEAMSYVESLMAICEAREWPEPLCRGHIQAAIVRLDRAVHHRDPDDVVLAVGHLDAAGQVAGGMSVTDVEIAYQLATFKAELVRTELDPAGQLDIVWLESIVARVDVLIETSGLSLATPEVIAARGVLAFEEGSVEDAGAHWDRAITECGRQGNALTPSSPRSVVHWLGRRIERDATPAPTGSASDLIDRVGTPLRADWMIGVLREVAGSRLP
jgi:tetratricopeptide (TPR) repeat protein